MMKTIVRIDDGISIYLLPESTEIELFDNRVEVGNPIEFIIADCNSANVAVYAGVSAPEDWRGWKYMFDGKNWDANPDYVAPEPPQ